MNNISSPYPVTIDDLKVLNDANDFSTLSPENKADLESYIIAMVDCGDWEYTQELQSLFDKLI